jgi:adenylate cyclase
LRVAIQVYGFMAKWFSRRIGWVRVLAFIGLLCGLVIRIGDPEPVSALRFAAFDLYHQSKPRELVPLPVTILDVDDRSLEEIGQWPWPRNKIADLVDRATEAGIAAMAFDIIFSEPDRLSPRNIVAEISDLPPDLKRQLDQLQDNDAILAQAFAASRIVVGQTSVRTEAGNRENKRDMADVEHAFLGPDPMPFLLKFPDVVQNLPELEASAAGRGVFSVRPDPDGIYRRVPVVMSVQGKVRLGLGPELLRVATGGEPFAIRSNDAGIEGVVLARQLVPTAGDGTIWPYLSPSSRSRYVSAADLLAGRVEPGRLSGQLVLVGTSAIGLEDFRATPLGVAMAGVEIHAQVLENILTQSLLIRPNYAIAVELVTTFALCLLVIVFAPGLAARRLIGSSVLLLGGYVSLSYYAFHAHRILIDPTFPLLAATLAVMLISTVNYLREERQKQEIRGAFGQYVSPDLVDQLTRNQSALKLGGETRELTLLFSDVRGFTAIAEDFKDDPAALTALMNKFLTILSNAIMDNKGTIDKFMGDAVMAFWNAPLDNDDHVRSACRAALRMMADVATLNAAGALAEPAATETERAFKSVRGSKKRKQHQINVGIGINTGQCVVGNMGSDTRFDYTALGDPVNIASRLEGQSRFYGADIILGSSTAREILDEFAVLELDMVRVVGKTLPENIFALLGDETLRRDPRFQDAFERNDAMLQAYRSQDWDKAETALTELAEIFANLNLKLDDYIAIYTDRIATLRDTPPAPDWDGVFTMTMKK